jgi:PAS domain S-box-containing protein
MMHGIRFCTFRNYWPILLALSLILICSNNLYSQTLRDKVFASLTPVEKEWLTEHKTIRVGGEKDWAPYEFVDQSGTFSGSASEYLNIIHETLGIEFEIITDPTWNELLDMMRNKEIDLFPSLNQTPKRDEFILFTKPYSEFTDFVFRRDDEEPIESIDEILDRKVSVIQGYAIEEKLRGKFPSLNLAPAPNIETALQDLITRKVDAYVGDLHSTGYAINKYSLRGIVSACTAPFKPGTIHMGIRKDWPEFRIIIQKVLDRIDQSTYNEIQRRWLAYLPTDSNSSSPSQSIMHMLTEEEKEWLINHPVLRVSNEDDYAPFDFSVNGEARGLSIDYMRLLEKRLGVQFEFVNGYTWDELLRMARNKELDIMQTIVNTDERQEYLLFTEPFYDTPMVIVVHETNDSIHSFHDLLGKRVSVVAEYYQENILRDKYPEIEIVPVSNTAEALKAVAFKQADATFDVLGVVNHEIRSNFLPNIKIAGEVSNKDFGNMILGVAVRNDWPLLHSIILKAQKTITADETNPIWNRWISYAPQTSKLSIPKIEISNEEKEWLKENPVIKVGGHQNWPPYGYVNETGEYSGISRAYMDIIGNQLGVKIEFVLKPSPELLEMIQSDEIDLIPIVKRTENREELLDFTTPIGNFTNNIFINEKFPTVSTIDDLPGKKIGILGGGELFQRFKNKYPQLNVVSYKNKQDAFADLVSQNIDAFVGDLHATNFTIKRNSMSGIIPVFPSPLEPDSINIGVNKNSPILRGLIQKVQDNIPDEMKERILSDWSSAFDEDQKSSKPLVDLSKEEQRWLDDHPEIRFTGDPDWLPFEAFQPDGRYVGIVADHLKIIEERLGITINRLPVSSWTEALDKAANGEIDVISGSSSNPTFQQDYNHIGPYISNPIVLVMREGEKFVSDLNDIKNRKIAVIKNYGYVGTMQAIYPELVFNEVDNIHDGLEQVSTGQIDCLLCTLALGSYMIEEMGLSNLAFVGNTNVNMDLTIFVRKDWPVFHSILKKALASIEPQERREILSRWSKSGEVLVKIDYVLITQIIFVFAIILFLILYWNRRMAREMAKRRIVEKRLLDSETQFRNLLDSAPDGMIIINSDGDIVMANKQAERLFGYTKEELTNNKIELLVPERFRENHPSKRDLYFNNPKVRELEGAIELIAQGKDGSEFPVEVSLSPVPSEDGFIVAAAVRDATDRKRKERLALLLSLSGRKTLAFRRRL